MISIVILGQLLSRSGIAVVKGASNIEVRVGTVLGAELSPDGRSVDIAVRIDPAHVNLVRDNSRFWNVSGIGLDLGIGGLKMRAGSLESVLAGGIAFATPTKAGERVEDGTRFELAEAAEDAWLKWSPGLAGEER